MLTILVLLGRTMDEMYRHLSIEVDRHKKLNEEDEERPKWTVSDGLTRFFRPEQRDIKCEKCEEGRTATQTTSGVSRYVGTSTTIVLLW